MNLPSGDLFTFMSANWTDTATINYAGTDRTFLCPGAAQRAHSTVHQRAVGGLCLIFLRARVLGAVNASAWAHHGVHPVHLQYPLFPVTFPYAHALARASRTLRMALDAA